MLNIVAAMAGLTLILANQGRYLTVEETNSQLTFVDAASAKRDGDVISAKVYWAFSKPLLASGRPAMLIVSREEFNCATRQDRSVAFDTYDAGLRPIRQDIAIAPWRAPGPGSPNARLLANLCDGDALPSLGTNLRVVLRQYIERIHGGARS